MEGYIIPLLILFATIILILLKLRKSGRTPPGPWGIPIIGHLHLMAPIPHQALHKLSTKYGPLMHINLGSVPCVVVSSAEVAKEFLKTHEKSFLNRPKIAAMDYLTYGSADFAFAPYGPYWKFMNKLCMSQLLGGRTLEILRPVRREERMSLLNFLLKNARAGQSVDLGPELNKMTNNVISRMMMGQKCSDYEDNVGSLAKEILLISGMFNLQDFIWFCKNLDLQRFGKRLKDIRGRFDSMMDRIIKRHEEVRKQNAVSADGTKDVLHILLDIKEDPDADLKLTKENIKAFMMDVFSAGTDTSAITTEWALAELINHPSIMEKARQEIDSIVGRGNIVEETDIPHLPYLQAIVKETLRLHPTAPITLRESSEKCTVGEFDIPAKARIFINNWAIGRDPNHWEEPLEFKPERFLNSGSASKMDVRGQYFELLPFGSGRRMCPGTSLALHVVQATLAGLIQCFDWNVGEGRTVSMDEGIGLSLPRALPLVFVPVARLDPFPSI